MKHTATRPCCCVGAAAAAVVGKPQSHFRVFVSLTVLNWTRLCLVCTHPNRVLNSEYGNSSFRSSVISVSGCPPDDTRTKRAPNTTPHSYIIVQDTVSAIT